MVCSWECTVAGFIVFWCVSSIISSCCFAYWIVHAPLRADFRVEDWSSRQNANRMIDRRLVSLLRRFLSLSQFACNVLLRGMRSCIKCCQSSVLALLALRKRENISPTHTALSDDPSEGMELVLCFSLFLVSWFFVFCLIAEVVGTFQMSLLPLKISNDRE